ncbi:hypothetical protein WS67_05690 [Burkholderia singularis]|uniref:Uncharacterized protein n=1 Tax=Burkholderia singularis TaxID=1503053 RepID=A0A124P9R5_9BURK|nr:hypothetical protein WS67_05690 [Burkholderia singularis]
MPRKDIAAWAWRRPPGDGANRPVVCRIVRAINVMAGAAGSATGAVPLSCGLRQSNQFPGER